jgi:hypothetical protein
MITTGEQTQRRSLDELIGLRLSIVRKAADMLGLHFGDVRPHHSGRGTVGAYTLHIQCPWRIDGPKGTITGSDDRWEYAGPGEPPPNWLHEDGPNLQDERLDGLFGECRAKIGWVNDDNKFVVSSVRQGLQGDLALEFSDGHSISIFPASGEREAWRFFAPDDEHHLVFPAA